MNEIEKVEQQPKFNFNGVEIRVIGTPDNGPVFIASDVCAGMGLDNVTNAVARVEADGVISIKVIDNMGREQTVNALTIGGLFDLVNGSRKEAAREFRKWVNYVVLPTIRKTGTFTDTTGVLHRGPVQEPSQLEKAERILRMVSTVSGIFKDLGGMDSRDEFVLRNITALATNQIQHLLTGEVAPEVTPSVGPKPISYHLALRDIRTTSASQIGVRAHKLYMERYDSRNEDFVVQYIDGAERRVMAYREKDWDLVNKAIDEYLAKQTMAEA